MTGLPIRVARALDSEWLEALAIEAGECPTGRSRAVWMLGGTRLLVLALLRKAGLTIASFAAAAAAVLALGLAGSAANPAVARNRIELPMLLAVLALLPALTRSLFGPVRPERAARAVRIVGYVALLALIAAKAVEARDGLQLGNYFQISKIGPLQAALWLLICAYAAILLYATSRHVPLKPRVLTLAVVTGVAAGSGYFLRYGLDLWAWHVGVAVPLLRGGARGDRVRRSSPRSERAHPAQPRSRRRGDHRHDRGAGAGTARRMHCGDLTRSRSVALTPVQSVHSAARRLGRLEHLGAATPASMLLVVAPPMALCTGTFGACLTLVQAPTRARS